MSSNGDGSHTVGPIQAASAKATSPTGTKVAVRASLLHFLLGWSDLWSVRKRVSVSGEKQHLRLGFQTPFSDPLPPSPRLSVFVRWPPKFCRHLSNFRLSSFYSNGAVCVLLEQQRPLQPFLFLGAPPTPHPLSLSCTERGIVVGRQKNNNNQTNV